MNRLNVGPEPSVSFNGSSVEVVGRCFADGPSHFRNVDVNAANVSGSSVLKKKSSAINQRTLPQAVQLGICSSYCALFIHFLTVCIEDGTKVQGKGVLRIIHMWTVVH